MLDILRNCLLLFSLFVQLHAGNEALSEPNPTSGRVLLIPVSDQGRFMLDDVQAKFIINQLDHAEESGFAAVVLVIDTYGGVLFSAREVTERLIKLKIPSYAFVETKAVSGGTFIAWACDEIAMGEFTTMGDAQVVTTSIEGTIEAAPEKIVSVYRSDWKKLSEARNRPFELAQAFFDPSHELLWVGEGTSRQFMTRSSYDALPLAERPAIQRVVSPKDQLLTLHAKEADELGIARQYPDLEAFLMAKGITKANRVAANMTLGQLALRYLGANPWLMGVLLLIGLNALYTEVKTPGFGVPGFTAIVCFLLFFGSRYLLGTASGLELMIFTLGLTLCIVEIFITPGVGLLGASGVALMLVSMALASLPPMKGLPNSPLLSNWIYSVSAITLVGFGGGLLLLFVSLPLVSKLAKPLHSEMPGEMRAEDGFVFKGEVEAEPNLVGTLGPAVGTLRPGGKMALPDGSLIDVVSEGSFIEAGKPLRIKRIEGNRVIVVVQESANV